MRWAIRGSLCLSALLAAITPLHALATSLPPGVSDMLEITDSIRDQHYWTIAIHGVTGAGKIPLSAFARYSLSRLAEVRWGLSILRNLNLGDGK